MNLASNEIKKQQNLSKSRLLQTNCYSLFIGSQSFSFVHQKDLVLTAMTLSHDEIDGFFLSWNFFDFEKQLLNKLKIYKRLQ